MAAARLIFVGSEGAALLQERSKQTEIIGCGPNRMNLFRVSAAG
jgi:hypothetical protein